MIQHMEDEEDGMKAITALNGSIREENDKPLLVSKSRNPDGPKIPLVKLQLKSFPQDLSAGEIRSLFQPYGTVFKATVINSKFDAIRRAIVVSNI